MQKRIPNSKPRKNKLVMHRAKNQNGAIAQPIGKGVVVFGTGSKLGLPGS